MSAAVTAATTITTISGARSQMATAPGSYPGEPLVEDELAVSPDRLRDDERRQHRRREHLHEGERARRQLSVAEQNRPRRLEQDRHHADDRDHEPGHRRSPIRQARLAATIGTPGGANGRSTSVIAPATRAVASARRLRRYGARRARKSAANAASIPIASGSSRSPMTVPSAVPPTQTT